MIENMISAKTNSKYDALGAIASFFCLIHCLATPILLATMTTTSGFGLVFRSQMWEWVDLLLLGVSLVAVIYSSVTTTKKWISYALSFSWGAMTFCILNEKFLWINVMEFMNYIPSISLIYLHLYNRKHCQCDVDHCCID